jgi:hypothetical protein
VPGEGKLGGRGEDAQAGAGSILDEDRLAETELGRDALTILGGDRAPVEENPERVAVLARWPGEDAQDVERGAQRPAARGSAGTARSRTG